MLRLAAMHCSSGIAPVVSGSGSSIIFIAFIVSSFNPVDFPREAVDEPEIFHIGPAESDREI